MNKKGLILSLAAFACLFVFACGSAIPGDAEGRKALQTQLGGRVENGAVKIISFKKTNGQISAGGAEYKMDWEAEVECAQTVVIPLNALFTETCREGAKLPLKSIYYFDKTENGWIARRPGY
jgi:hypothetical protein